MSRYLFCLVLIAAATAAFTGEVKMKISGKGLTGTSTASTKLNPDGSKLQRMTTKVTSNGQTAEIIDESLCSKTGRPLRHTVKTSVGGKLQQTIIAGFGNKEVSVKIQAGGQTKSTTVAYPKGASLDVKSEFWFITSKPAPGGTDQYYRFNVENLTWEKTKVVYQGVQTIKVNGKDVKGHLMVGDKGKAWLDDKGDPLKMEWGGVTVTRA